jgi:pilus assembly protein CpaB
MNKRLLSIFAFAAVVSLGATLLFWRLFSGRMAELSKPESTKVFVAVKNLDLGTIIHDADIKDRDWVGPVPQNALLKKEDIVGRGVASIVYEGEALIESRLAPKGSGGGLASIIPDGMRAVAVRVNEIIGVAGFLTPGMRVDILISGTAPGISPTLCTLAKTVLQNIAVLSAGQNIQKDAEGKPVSVPVINLLVTPEQAETLSLASSETKIQLVLRNPLDTKIAKTPGTALAYLFKGGAGSLPESDALKTKPAVRKPVKVVTVIAQARPEPVVIEVIHGTQRSQAKFGQAQEAKQ